MALLSPSTKKSPTVTSGGVWLITRCAQLYTYVTHVRTQVHSAGTQVRAQVHSSSLALRIRIRCARAPRRALESSRMQRSCLAALKLIRSIRVRTDPDLQSYT